MSVLKENSSLNLAERYINEDVERRKQKKLSTKFWRKSHNALMKYGIGVQAEFSLPHKHIATPEVCIDRARVRVVGRFAANRADNFQGFSIEALIPSEDETIIFLAGMESQDKSIPIDQAKRGLKYIKRIKGALRRQA